ncbi:hypothetical protein BCV70DRAFT_197067 [Testicularia cyperi]|uniref:Uncharacterized protein n=1 Tax=Testicularia cyperi TaxID=1882483 RepID=A0A317XWZ8_9BASI|nr:hypothetical protein BCV70DRAFT_197067 [Testicularia cyperi]
MDVNVVTSSPSSSSPSPIAMGRGSPAPSSLGFSQASSSIGPMFGATAGRKRRRSALVSTLSSSSDEDSDSLPPSFRIRLGNYISESAAPFSPRSQSPLNPTALESTTSSSSLAPVDRTGTSVSTSMSSISAQQAVSWQTAPTDGMELEADIDDSFQAMQVDSPSPSPSARKLQADSYFPVQQSTRRFSTTPPSMITQPASAHGIPSESKRPDPLSLLMPSLPPASTSSVFPSAAMISSSRRNSRPSTTLTSLQYQYLPTAPSPLACTSTFNNMDELDNDLLGNLSDGPDEHDSDHDARGSPRRYFHPIALDTPTHASHRIDTQAASQPSSASSTSPTLHHEHTSTSNTLHPNPNSNPNPARQPRHLASVCRTASRSSSRSRSRSLSTPPSPSASSVSASAFHGAPALMGPSLASMSTSTSTLPVPVPLPPPRRNSDGSTPTSTSTSTLHIRTIPSRGDVIPHNARFESPRHVLRLSLGLRCPETDR